MNTHLHDGVVCALLDWWLVDAGLPDTNQELSLPSLSFSLSLSLSLLLSLSLSMLIINNKHLHDGLVIGVGAGYDYT